MNRKQRNIITIFTGSQEPYISLYLSSWEREDIKVTKKHWPWRQRTDASLFPVLWKRWTLKEGKKIRRENDWKTRKISLLFSSMKKKHNMIQWTVFAVLFDSQETGMKQRGNREERKGIIVGYWLNVSFTPSCTSFRHKSQQDILFSVVETENPSFLFRIPLSHVLSEDTSKRQRDDTKRDKTGRGSLLERVFSSISSCLESEILILCFFLLQPKKNNCGRENSLVPLETHGFFHLDFMSMPHSSFGFPSKFYDLPMENQNSLSRKKKKKHILKSA